jgi:hypothetical protein
VGVCFEKEFLEQDYQDYRMDRIITYHFAEYGKKVC